MADPKVKWHRIAGSLWELEFAENGIAMVRVNQKTICVARHEENLYAFSARCPHAGGMMAEGYIDALGHIVCPTHRYKFSMKNGRNISGEGYYLKTYPLENRSDGIYLGMSDTGFSLW
jgi:3-phenylpropionate/trans-cinnamate dioxygenase ferredoxin subunit